MPSDLHCAEKRILFDSPGVWGLLPTLLKGISVLRRNSAKKMFKSQIKHGFPALSMKHRKDKTYHIPTASYLFPSLNRIFLPALCLEYERLFHFQV